MTFSLHSTGLTRLMPGIDNIYLQTLDFKDYGINIRDIYEKEDKSE